MTPFQRHEINIKNCERCPRLRKHCLKIAEIKKRAYQDQKYYGKPVPGFGDPHAQLLIVGLAPAAHGANRTGRIFTGDRSGEWLYRALFESGFSNQPESQSKEDGLTLKNAYITCIARCAPPQNKLLPIEIKKCSPFLEKELELLKEKKVILALGNVAYQGIKPFFPKSGPRFEKFSHGKKIPLPEYGLTLLLSYHCSQQNTFTRKLTRSMFKAVFECARELCQK